MKSISRMSEFKRNNSMIPDPQESLVIKAGEEDPRCLICDRFIEGWRNGDSLYCGCDQEQQNEEL